jgi:pimeloyl-ACP methyl ester carboxylesterase
MSVVESTAKTFVNTKFGRTHYVLQGPATAEKLVVFSHGASLFCSVWNGLSKMFVEKHGYRTLAYDFYGHGFSSIPEGPYNIELFSQQLEDLLFQLGLLKGVSIILVGHSMGAVVSCEFAVRYPKLVERVILMSSAGLTIQGSLDNPFPGFMHAMLFLIRTTSLLDPGAYFLAKFLHLQANLFRYTAADLERVTNELNEGIAGLQSHWLLARFLSPATLRFLRSVRFLLTIWLYQLGVNPDRAKVFLSVLRHCPLIDADHSSTFRHLGDTHHEPKPESCKKPVMLLWGEDDTLTPTPMLEELHRFMPDARVKVFSNTDHSMFLQQPDKIFELISQFLNTPASPELDSTHNATEQN